MHPLSHHEILVLIEPFARRGRHVDLRASSRPDRRLLFRPIEHADAAPALAGLSETLQFENPAPDRFRLTRALSLACGLEAHLCAEGPDVDVLLAWIEAVPVQAQFCLGTGFTIALSHRLDAAAGKAGGASSAVDRILTHGVAEVAGLTVRLRAPAVRGVAADITLEVAPGDPIRLPEDLLAVLGWDWARLIRGREGWSTRLRLSGREPGRSRRAEIKLERTVAHLARTLAEPPAHFHQRMVAARWRVAFRRAIPLLTFIGMIAGALAIPHIAFAQGAVAQTLISSAAPALIGLVFWTQELARFEIPPLPSPDRAPAWR